jgi:VWFA-related protein
MTRIRLLGLTLFYSIAIFSQNSPITAGNTSEAQTPSQTILLTVETASPVSVSSTDVLVSVDKKPFAPVSKLESASAAPLDFILVVDSSSSAVRSKLRTTALVEVPKFITTVRNSGITVRTAVVDFNAASRVVQNFTSDSIESSFERLSSGGGSTLHDSLSLAARLAQQSPASNRRIILVVTDGEDNLSSTTADEVVKAATRACSPIYALSLGEPPAQYAPLSGRGDKFLKEVSAQTGGKAYFPTKEKQVAEVLEAIRSDMQMQYFATVAAPTNKRGFHQVQFKTSVAHGTVRGATAMTNE